MQQSMKKNGKFSEKEGINEELEGVQRKIEML